MWIKKRKGSLGVGGLDGVEENDLGEKGHLRKGSESGFPWNGREKKRRTKRPRHTPEG